MDELLVYRRNQDDGAVVDDFTEEVSLGTEVAGSYGVVGEGESLLDGLVGGEEMCGGRRRSLFDASMRKGSGGDSSSELLRAWNGDSRL